MSEYTPPTYKPPSTSTNFPSYGEPDDDDFHDDFKPPSYSPEDEAKSTTSPVYGEHDSTTSFNVSPQYGDSSHQPHNNKQGGEEEEEEFPLPPQYGSEEGTDDNKNSFHSFDQPEYGGGHFETDDQDVEFESKVHSKHEPADEFETKAHPEQEPADEFEREWDTENQTDETGEWDEPSHPPPTQNEWDQPEDETTENSFPSPPFDADNNNDEDNNTNNFPSPPALDHTDSDASRQDNMIEPMVEDFVPNVEPKPTANETVEPKETESSDQLVSDLSRMDETTESNSNFANESQDSTPVANSDQETHEEIEQQQEHEPMEEHKDESSSNVVVDQEVPEVVVDKKLKYEQQLSAPDAIMDTNVFSTLAGYLQEDGSPEELIRMLSDNYVGFAQMSNLLHDWLLIAGEDNESVNELVEENIKTLIFEHFDEQRANSIFDDDAPTPTWLAELITFSPWRNVLYQLSEQRRECLMLNFAIKRISDAGYLSEIASVPIVANQLSVFSNVLTSLICALSRKQEPQQVADFARMACTGQHTYLFTQGVLTVAGQETDNPAFFTRLKQEIQAQAHQKGHNVLAYELLINGANQYPSLATSLTAIHKQGHITPDDIDPIYTLFASSVSEEDLPETFPLPPPPPSPSSYANEPVPPVDMLRVPVLFDLLIKKLFTAGKPVDKAHRHKYLFILAFAASVDPHAELPTQALRGTIEALDKTLEICDVGRLDASSVADLCKQLSFPVACMGLCQWLRTTMAHPNFFSNFSKQNLPPHFCLLDEMACLHPSLREPVFNVLIFLYHHPHRLDPLVAVDVKRALLNRLIFLLSLGLVLPVLAFVADIADKTDLSLLLHFITQVTSIVEEPFSVEFLQPMVDLITRKHIMAALKKKVALHSALAPFLKSAIGDQSFRGLSNAQQELVKQLAKDVRPR
eukprot:m.137200 g.137200  ORF g.137200 m.137200 type:complete len:919 (-) comp23983_c0_seq1:198-2954(-)